MEGMRKSTRTSSTARSKAAGTKKRTTAKAEYKASLKNITQPLVFGLDIGTRSIVGTVGYRESTNRFVVVAQVVKEHETRAMLDGQIHDIQAVADTICEVKEQLEKMIGRTLTDVCIAAAGRVLKTVVAKAQMEFTYETVVTEEHIYSLDMLGVENAYEQLRAETAQGDMKFYCVGYSVIRYFQNEYPISNLEGHKANSIQTELIATFLPEEVVDGLYVAVEKAGLFVANLTLEPIAAINVAIPERFRLLNIALVDVGAGTSDISITNEGSIIAYGMIPAAGDEVTECIAKRYLTEFAEAEQIKCKSTTRKQVTYHDIMGLSQKVSSEEVTEVVAETVRSITKQVADKIIALNGGKPVSAVFVVGGGGKVNGFVESLAEYLELPQERVALRGSEVLGGVQFLQPGIKVDSLLVTPIGICMNFYEQKNNFIFVTVNEERIKLYDNSKLTAVDAALQVGFPKEDLFPKRGKTVNYTVNGEKRMQRGEAGEAAIVRINEEEGGLSTPIAQNDKIEITPSTTGADAVLEIGQIPEYHAVMQFRFNGKQIRCPRFVRVNGELVSAFYQLQDGDVVEIVDYYTLEQVLEFMDIVYRGRVYVNNVIAEPDTKVYDNFSVACEIKKEEPEYETLMQEYGEDQVPEAVLQGMTQDAVDEAENGQQEVSDYDTTVERTENSAISGEQSGHVASQTQSASSGSNKQPVSQTVDLLITVNRTPVILKNKKEYILVDVLDFYPFDMSVAGGIRLETKVNGIDADFTTPLKEGDQVTLQWVQ